MVEKLKARIQTIKEGFKTIVESLEEIEKNYSELPQQVKGEMEIPDVDLHEVEK